jgi:hypothetical protein
MKHLGRLLLTLSILTLAPAAAPAQHRPGPWRPWVTLGTGESLKFNSLAFSADSGQLVAGRESGSVHVWNVLNGHGERWLEAKHLQAILALHVAGNSQRLLAAGETGLRAWELPGGKMGLDISWSSKTKLLSVATFASDGQWLACAADADVVELWKVGSKAPEAKLTVPTKGFVCSLAYSADSSQLAVGCSDGLLQLWRTADGKLLVTLQPGDGGLVRGLAFAPDGTTLAVARGREPLTLWELPAGKPQAKLPAAAPPYHAVAFSPCGDAVAAGNGRGAVQIWTIPDGKQAALLPGHAGAVLALAFAPNGRLLASSGTDALVKVWDSYRFPRLPHTPLNALAVTGVFADLAHEDEARASRAVLALLAAPDQALPLLRGVLPQGHKPDVKHVDKLLGDLQSDKFSVRDKANKELKAMGQAIRPELRRWLQMPLDLETQRRVEYLLNLLVQAMVTPAERLLIRRATIVLERLGGPEAEAILEGLLYGLPDDETLAQTRAALARLR